MKACVRGLRLAVVVAFGSGVALAAVDPPTALAAAHKITAVPATAPLIYFNIVDESKVPKIDESLLPVAPQFGESVNDERDALWTNPLAFGARPLSGVDRLRPQFLNSIGSGGSTGVSAAGFDGMREEYRVGVGRPDQALAAGPKGILLSINSKLALYNSSGQLALGWPKEAARFFGFPARDYLVDPRAVYDTWDHRYWAAFLNDASFGGYFLAVSRTSDPNGMWYVYGFKVAQGHKVFADFTMLGIDQHNVSISSHKDTQTGKHSFLLSNDIFVLPKKALESGSGNVVGRGFIDIAVDGIKLDTLEPVMVQTGSGTPPPSELFTSTYGFNFKCYGGTGGPCRQMLVFDVALNGSHASLSHAVVKTPPYQFTPSADTPSCNYCLEAVGPMMSTPGVYERGLIDFAFGLGVPSPQRFGVAAILWGQLQPVFSGTKLASATLTQNGVVGFPNNQAAMFPSVMANGAGDMFLLFDSSGPALDPSVYVAARRASDPQGIMTSTLLLKRGLASPPVRTYAYGDFTAASFDPGSGVWFASQYARTAKVYGDYVSNVQL